MTLPTLAVDFDGVIHRYSKGWQGGRIYDDLMPGAKEGLLALHKRYTLVCFTARHNLTDVEDWMRVQGIRHLFSSVTNRKPAAVAYLDDRAIRFVNWQNALDDVVVYA